MNRLQENIKEILEPPKRVIEDDRLGWCVKVLVSGWGHEYEKEFWATSKAEIEKFRPGYWWWDS